MSKDAFYFSHDSNAQHDPKMIRLRRTAGLEGVGLYWCVIERLREAESYRLEAGMIPDICFDLRVDEQVFQAIFESGLLEQEDGFFFSRSLLRRMEIREAKREQASRAGRASAERRSNASSTTVQRKSNDRSTPVQPKKGKESKGKESSSSNDGKNASTKSKRTPTLVTEEDLQGWETSEAYEHVNVRREYAKATEWLKTKPGRKMTKQFFVNWLNRVEAPAAVKQEPEEDPYKYYEEANRLQERLEAEARR